MALEIGKAFFKMIKCVPELQRLGTLWDYKLYIYIIKQQSVYKIDLPKKLVPIYLIIVLTFVYVCRCSVRVLHHSEIQGNRNSLVLLDRIIFKIIKVKFGSANCTAS